VRVSAELNDRPTQRSCNVLAACCGLASGSLT